jgi:hypothetical protein
LILSASAASSAFFFNAASWASFASLILSASAASSAFFFSAASWASFASLILSASAASSAFFFSAASWASFASLILSVSAASSARFSYAIFSIYSFLNFSASYIYRICSISSLRILYNSPYSNYYRFYSIAIFSLP